MLSKLKLRRRSTIKTLMFIGSAFKWRVLVNHQNYPRLCTASALWESTQFLGHHASQSSVKVGGKQRVASRYTRRYGPACLTATDPGDSHGSDRKVTGSSPISPKMPLFGSLIRNSVAVVSHVCDKCECFCN